MAGVAFVFLFILSIYQNWGNLYGSLPPLERLENPSNEIASVVYSSDGVELGKYFRENRTPVRYEDLSENLINALIASEDIRFHEHSGIDFKGTLAVPFYLLKGRRRGSSTITQQLAKNLFKTRRNEEMEGSLTKTPILGIITVKMKEWILATMIEKSYTKKEIITMYLNQMEYGHNAFGIKAAAKAFFNTTPDQLTVEQSAILVGLLQAPTFYSPINRPHNAVKVRNKVMGQMAKYGFISQQQYDSLRATDIFTDPQVESHITGLAPYFREELKKELLKICQEEGYDLFADGLRIYTTLDSRMQAYAEQAVEEHMQGRQEEFFKHWKGRNPWIDENMREMPNFLENAMRQTEVYRNMKDRFGEHTDSIEWALKQPHSMKIFAWDAGKERNYEKDTVLSSYDSLRYYKHILRTGMIVLDPYSGQVRAWVGGINYKYLKYDHVKLGMRQPGSTFKPIVYAAAIAEKKFHPCMKVVDAPITFTMENGDVWTPKNSDNKYSNNAYTLRQALAMSINTVAAYLVSEVKPARVVEYAEEKFGFRYMREKYNYKSRLEAVPAICLGTSDVSIMELTSAYATFANEGVWVEPLYITHITDKNGRELKRFRPKTIEAFDKETAFTMVHMLRGSSEERGGTSLGLYRYNFRKENEVAGKTGTTSNYSDAWYMGMTKDLVVGVWVGAEDRAVHFRSIEYGQGARLAMPQFGRFMDKVYADPSLGFQKGGFPRPEKMSIELDCQKYEQANVRADSLNNYIMPKRVNDDDIF